MSSSIAKDAAEFGVHVKAGGWRLGLLVARNVEKGAGTGRPPKAGRETFSHGKVSAAEFAEQAGTSPARVLRYLSAWEHASADGLVPPAHTLSPGEDIDLDVDKLGDWSDYYPPIHSLNHRSEEHRRSIEDAATAEGTTAEQVQRASASAPALAAAIKSNPRIADVAAKALDERYSTQGQTSTPRQEPTSKPLALIGEFRTLHRTVERLMGLIVEGKAVVSDDERGALLEEVAWLQNALSYIESGLNAGSLDKALAELLEG